MSDRARLGLGTAPLGGLYEAVSEASARATIERAWELGIRDFDTAPLYGHGLSELRLGAVLRGLPRDQFRVSTKVGRLLRADGRPSSDAIFKGAPALTPVPDYSYAGAIQSHEESLRRLGLERVDTLFIHSPSDDLDAALDNAFPALQALRDAGSVRAIGVGMGQAEMLARIARETDADCLLVAGCYSLLDQSALADLMPVCEERNIALLVGGVFNGGILADPAPGARFNYQPASESTLARARALAVVCARHGVSLAAAALQFPLGQPAVEVVLIGCRTAAEVEDNLRAFATPIPPELWSELKLEGLLPSNAPTPS